MSDKKKIWQQLVDKKAEWIGGTFGENDSFFGEAPHGVIADMRLVQGKTPICTSRWMMSLAASTVGSHATSTSSTSPGIPMEN